MNQMESPCMKTEPTVHCREKDGSLLENRGAILSRGTAGNLGTEQVRGKAEPEDVRVMHRDPGFPRRQSFE